MADPILTQISQTLANRLAVIQIAGGYYTDAGLNVLQDRSQFDPRYDTFPLVSVKVLTQSPEERERGGRRPQQTSRKLNTNLEIIIYGAIEITATPPPASHLLAADIIRAMTLETPIEEGDGLLPGELVIGDPETDRSIIIIEQRYTLRYLATFGQ